MNFFKELCDNKKLQKYKGLPLFKKSELYSNKEKGVTYRKKDCVAYAATREKHYQKSIKQYKEENK